MMRLCLQASLGLLLGGLLSACSSITVLRTSEIKAVGDSVRTGMERQLDSLRLVVDSLRAEQRQYNDRLKADFAVLNSRVVEEGERDESRMEEILYRTDMLISKSDKILSKRVVVDKRESAVVDSTTAEAQEQAEMQAVYNAGRADYHRGEYKLAYGSFRQVFETVKTGELAENSLYWMALCMLDAGQPANAKALFMRLVEQFPEGAKMCVTLYKLSSLAGEEGDVELRKQYLQRVLALKKCAESNEFLKAASELDGLLEGKEGSVSDSTAGQP